MNTNPQDSPNNGRRRRRGRGLTLTPFGTFLLFLFNALLIGGMYSYFGGILPAANPTPTQESTPNPTDPPENTPAPTSTLPAIVAPEPEIIVITATPGPDNIRTLPGLMVISRSDVGYKHLFAYHPEAMAFTRITGGNNDDIHPAVSPDGTKVAFSSNRGHGWDIYILDLITGVTTQLTDDPAYEGNPAWSPDGQWLAYEKYQEDNLDIFIQTTDKSLPAVQVTFNPAVDSAPSWSPTGNLLAFHSNRDGLNNIWIVEIDKIGQPEALYNYTSNPALDQSKPVWSPDGSQLAWIVLYEGYDSIFVGDYKEGERSAVYIGSGSRIAWDPTGQYLLTDLRNPDQSSLTAYNAKDKTTRIAPILLPGRLDGISWGSYFPESWPQNIQEIAEIIPNAPWQIGLTPGSGTVFGRQYTLELPNVTAPFPALNALAVEPFFALRDRVNEETGWDVLSDLENAFIPLTQPLPPGRSSDWLYTGRAIALNTTFIDLGWMVVAREAFGTQTYWRVFIKTRMQDGSQGRPITQFPWDFFARFTGNTTHFEEGGTEETVIPTGYYIDFTDLALEYGWERQPALSNWKHYYQGARFNVFAVTSGLDWEQAMLQLYPQEILLTP